LLRGIVKPNARAFPIPVSALFPSPKNSFVPHGSIVRTKAAIFGSLGPVSQIQVSLTVLSMGFEDTGGRAAQSLNYSDSFCGG
jgi:hypothetical protein